MKRLYVIAGCNGAGKTTASYTILPEILNCKEFVNADEIARGLSPFQPEKAGIEAGRLMLVRIKTLIESGENVAFFYLNSPELAISRVAVRVKEGGHNIPEDIIRRRYESGLINFFKLYKSLIDNWMLINNSGEPYQIIAEGSLNEKDIAYVELWNDLNTKYNG